MAAEPSPVGRAHTAAEFRCDRSIVPAGGAAAVGRLRCPPAFAAFAAGQAACQSRCTVGHHPARLQCRRPAPGCLPRCRSRPAAARCAAEGFARHYQYLVLPLDRISGIESPALLRADAPNYFAAAWAARRHTEQALGQPLPRAVASLALNSPHGRSQHQLHIHVDCLRADVLAQLQRMQPGIGAQWAVLPEPLRGHAYQARWLGGTALTANPIRLLADDLAAPGDMASWSLLVSGQPAADGAPGFLLLATRRDTEQGNNASAEELQDHACVAVTGAGGPLDGVR